MKPLLVSFAALLLFGCSGGSGSAPPDQAKGIHEVPITSKSPEAIDHYKRGRDFADNFRLPEATEEFEAALKLDPDFVAAHVSHGNMTQAPEGLQEMERANEQAAALPEAERVQIEAVMAGRRGEFAKSLALWKQVTDAVPDDWHAHSYFGAQLVLAGNYDQAITELNKATARNPAAGAAYNMLGYAHLQKGDPDAAVESFRQYIRVAPSEPNAQDSFGEALMTGGKLAEAEEAFRKAISLSSNFGGAWQGVAYTRFFAGDSTAGNTALDSARAVASGPRDTVDADTIAGLAALGEGKMAEGLKHLDDIEKASDASTADKTSASMYRAVALVDESRYRDALPQIAKALQVIDEGKLPPAPANNMRRLALTVRAAAEGRMGDAAAAAKTLSELETAAAARPDDPLLLSAVHMARGMLAAAQKNLKSTHDHFDQCLNQDAYCHWQAFLVSRKAGDGSSADAARARLTKAYLRDPVYLYARLALKRMSPKQSD